MAQVELPPTRGVIPWSWKSSVLWGEWDARGTAIFRHLDWIDYVQVDFTRGRSVHRLVHLEPGLGMGGFLFNHVHDIHYILVLAESPRQTRTTVKGKN
jgi:hypothetical protein